LSQKPLGLLEKLDVLWIGSGPATLDVMDAEGIQFFGDAQLVQHRKINALPLAAIAQGSIIYFDLGFHNLPRAGQSQPPGGWKVLRQQPRICKTLTRENDRCRSLLRPQPACIKKCFKMDRFTPIYSY
jgi:hypothetical protein